MRGRTFVIIVLRKCCKHGESEVQLQSSFEASNTVSRSYSDVNDFLFNKTKAICAVTESTCAKLCKT